LPPALLEWFSSPTFKDPRMEQSVEQRTIKLATRFPERIPSTIQGRDILGIYYLPLATPDETFGVILLFIDQAYKPEPGEIKFFKRATRAIAQGLAQRSSQDKWVHAYQELQLNHIHQFNQINRLCQELALPLNAVSGVSEQIAKQNIQAIRDPSQLLVNSANHLRTLVKKLNEYVAHGSKNIELNSRVFSFSESITSYLREVRTLVEARGLTFSIHVDRNIPSQLIGDLDKIKQVISILTDNAIKFTLKGEIAIAIDVENQRAERMDIQFKVRDTGMGIPAKDLPELFVHGGQSHLEQYADMPSIRHGLRLAHRYVQLMDGHIDVTSRPGIGSEFSFIVPLKLPADASSGNSIETTLTMEAITVLPQNIISETERVKRDNHELIASLFNGLHRKLCDYDITSDQAIDGIIPVLKNTVYRKDLKNIKNAISKYDFDTACSQVKDLARALEIKIEPE
jgi:signal transduction histidine kinase